MNAPLKTTAEAATDFVRRHIGPSPRDISAMLSSVGANSLAELMSQTLDERKKDSYMRVFTGSIQRLSVAQRHASHCWSVFPQSDTAQHRHHKELSPCFCYKYSPSLHPACGLLPREVPIHCHGIGRTSVSKKAT